MKWTHWVDGSALRSCKQDAGRTLLKVTDYSASKIVT